MKPTTEKLTNMANNLKLDAFQNILLKGTDSARAYERMGKTRLHQ